MQKVESQKIQMQQNDKWQVYEPKNQDKTIFHVFNKQIKNILKLIILLSIIYLIFTIFSPLTLVIMGIMTGASFKLIKVKTQEIRKQGLINKVSPKWRQILFEKSIFDIYSDLLYFPLLTKIIGAFLKPMIAKPHPQDLQHSFQNLPQNIQLAISKKGLLNLVPQPIKEIVIDKQRRNNFPKRFGDSSWQWYNLQKYENHHQKVHQHTIAKRLTQKIDDKITWTGFLGVVLLVTLGIYKMKPYQMKRMLIQNGSFVGVLLVTIIALIKLKKLREKMQKQKQQQRRLLVIQNYLDNKEE